MNEMNRLVKKEHLKAVGNFLKQSGKVIAPILGVVLSSVTISDLIDAFRYSGNVGYDDAVKVIMSSSMLGSDKARIMQVLKRDEDSEFYKAVIETVRSSMLGSTKIQIIENMCRTE